MGRKALDFSSKVDPRTGLMVVEGRFSPTPETNRLV